MPVNIGWAASNAISPLAPVEFDRQPVGPHDVKIDIEYCGVCHSDVHQARDEFGGALATNFPCMPGHEIVGIVAEAGADVSAHRVGDRVGVGCMVFWGDPDNRVQREEQYQMPPATFTYNAPDPETNEVTFGGYSDQIVVDEHFVLRIPEALKPEVAAPILCAGVTTWSPLEHWGIGPGTTIGVAGIGGLGHMAIQLAKARGADRVVALTTDPGKRQAALDLGADDVIVMSDSDAVEQQQSSLGFILSTIPTAFDMNPYLSLLQHDGTLVSVGMLEPSVPGGIDFGLVSQKRLTVGGSMIGDIAETQAVLDFCAEHDITPDIEIIPIDRINDAFDRVVDRSVRFRYVIDNASLRAGS